MSERDIDELIREWSDLGEDHLPDRFLQGALTEVETTAQTGAWRASLEGLIMRTQPATILIGVAAVVILSVAAYFTFFRSPAGDEGPSPSATGSPTQRVSTPSPSVVAEASPRAVESSTIDVGGALTGLQATEDALYASTEDRIVRIDPASGQATTLFTVPDAADSCAECTTGPGFEFAVGEGSVWVAYHLEVQSVIRRFDLVSGELQAEIVVGAPDGGGAGASDVAVAFGSVWTVQCHSGTVARIDPASNQQVQLIPIADGAVCQHDFSIATDEASVWVSVITDDGVAVRDWVYKIDPATNAPVGFTPIEGTANPCGRFAIDDTLGVWVNSCPESEGSALIQVDTDDADGAPGSATVVPLSGYLGDPAVIDGLVWVPRVSTKPLGAAVLVGVDPGSLQVVDLIQLGSATRAHSRSATALAVAFDALWVGGDGTTLLRIPLSELAN